MAHITHYAFKSQHNKYIHLSPSLPPPLPHKTEFSSKTENVGGKSSLLFNSLVKSNSTEIINKKKGIHIKDINSGYHN